MKKLPEKWQKSEKSLRAVQLVFEFSKSVSTVIRDEAHRHGLSTSDQIRTIIGLPAKQPKRPRLSVSLSEEDYLLLGERYGLAVDDKQGIRQAITEEIVRYTEDKVMKKV